MVTVYVSNGEVEPPMAQSIPSMPTFPGHLSGICHVIRQGGGEFVNVIFFSPISLSLFHVEGFRLCRCDRKAGGGGLMVFVRGDICFIRVKQLKGLSSGNRSDYETNSQNKKARLNPDK